jgi:iron(III) transport system permease protein
MQWDVGLGRAAIHTLLISGGAGLLATFLAAILSFGIFFVRIPLGRWCGAWVSSMLLIPVYVQATAWSAGFGIQGWWRLSQVDAAKAPWWGILSVIWIHAVAALPACFLILSYGWHRMRDGTYEQAWSEFGPKYVAARIIPRRWAPWLATAFLWTFCMTQNDMVVTNLFQVPTLCESVYQQVQFGKLRIGPIALACSVAALCGFVAAFTARRFHRRSRVEAIVPQGSWDPIPGKRTRIGWAVPGLVWGIVGMTVLLPWLGMMVRIGIESRMIDNQPVRVWSIHAVASSLGHVLDFGTEIGWSCSLACWTTMTTMVLALGLVHGIPFRRGSSWVVGVMVFLLALPGPIVNLSVSWLFHTALPLSMQFLGDQTLLGPILALQSRCLPVAYGILWLARGRYEAQHDALLAMDAGLPAWLRAWVWLRYARSAIGASALACAMIAMGDLASYLLVQPPGVTTVAMRMFDLLHYGIRNREASLALVMSALAALPSWWLFRTSARLRPLSYWRDRPD